MSARQSVSTLGRDSSFSHGVLSFRSARAAAALLAFVAIVIPGHLSGWLVERLFAGGALLFSAFVFSQARLYGRPLYGTLRASIVVGLVLAIEIVYVLGTLISQFRGSSESNLMEFGRYPALAFIAMLFGSVATQEFTDAMGRICRICVAYIALGALSLLIDLPLVSSFYEVLYAETKTALAFGSKVRVTFPFENPNYLGFFLLSVMAFFLHVDQRKSRLLFIPVSAVLLIFTGSRAGVAGFALLAALYICRQIWLFASARTNQLFSGCATVLVFVAVLLAANAVFGQIIRDTSRTQSTVESLTSGRFASEGAVTSRLELVHLSFDRFLESPVIGWGAADFDDLEVFDNQYMLWMVRGGIVGTLLVLTLYSVFVLSAVRASRRHGRTGLVDYSLIVLWMLASGAFLENVRLMIVFMAFVAAFGGVGREHSTNDLG